MKRRRVLEFVAQIYLGDGVTGLLVPRRHMLLWKDAFRWRLWQNGVQWLADHPGTVRLLGVIEIAFGVWGILRSSREQT